MKALAIAALAGLFIAMPAFAQQSETGPGTPGAKQEHPMRNPETGARGPSGGSPDTGPHGPRDVTKDAEPGKKKSAEELKKSGQTLEAPTTKKN